MVSLWWGQSALDEQIEKATSELLPANQEDIALHFMISDQIRGKKVNARDAMRGLKRRMEHKNPNVQIATLSLTDTCVKNAGDQFVREIASREFMETLSSMLHAPDCNLDVKNKILTVVQTWALAAKNNPNLSYLIDTYHLLQYERFKFPPVTEHVNALLLETAAPPEWTDSDVCERCRTPFTFTNRKHHCRNCGGTFCQECSSKSLPLPHLAIDENVRVCYGCYVKLKLSRVAKKDGVHTQQSSAPAQSMPHLAPTPAADLPKQQSAKSEVDEDKQFEEDLKKAIELSKKETEKNGGDDSHYAPSASLRDTTNPAPEPQYEQSAPANGGDEDDPELAAAIAASLRDMEEAQKSELEYYSVHRPAVRANKDELTTVEMENIELFAALMERVNATGGNVAYDDQINRLYTQIGSLQPRLVKNLDEATQKHKKYANLHEKLINAVRAYDRLLEERVMNSYHRTSSTGPYYGTATSLPYQNTGVNRGYAPSAGPLPPPPLQQPLYNPHLAVAAPAAAVTVPPVYPNMQPSVTPGNKNVAPSPYPSQSFHTSPKPATNVLPQPMAYNNPEQRQHQVVPQPQLGEPTTYHDYDSNRKQWHSQQQQQQPAYPSVPDHTPQHQAPQPAVVDETPLIEL